MIDKYHQPSHIQRASLMSATLAGIRLRDLRISAENFAAVQTLTTRAAAEPDPPGRGGRAASAARRGQRRLRPAPAVALRHLGRSAHHAGVGRRAQGLGLLRALAQALRLWSWGGLACDLVVVNAEPASYQMALQREIAALRERHVAAHGAQPGPARAAPAFTCCAPTSCRADEWNTLLALARVHLHADGRPLAHHVQAWIEQHERAFEQRHERSTTAVPVASWHADAAPAPIGQFLASTGEFRFEAGAGVRPARPWINVLSNPAFGAQISESGGGYTWADQQPAEPADRLVQRPGGRPAVRMVPAAGPAQPGGLERGAVGLGRRARALPAWRTARATPSSATRAATWRSPPPGAWTPTGA